MGTAIVTLKKGEGRTLKSGGAWVFDNEIDAITGNMRMARMSLFGILTDIQWVVALLIMLPKSVSV